MTAAALFLVAGVVSAASLLAISLAALILAPLDPRG